jgi:hypothetical protein
MFFPWLLGGLFVLPLFFVIPIGFSSSDDPSGPRLGGAAIGVIVLTIAIAVAVVVSALNMLG